MSSNLSSSACTLCGLPFVAGKISLKPEDGGQELFFCCQGCRMVYTMLMAATDTADPDRFKESDLYQRCLAAGIIPSSKEDLKRRATEPQVYDDPHQNISTIDDQDQPSLTLDLVVSGMWCPACAWVIEEGLKKSGGIFSVQCHFAMDRLLCRYNPVTSSPQKIRQKIEALGYKTSQPEETGQHSLYKKELIRLLVCAFLGMNVMMLSFALYTGFFSNFSEETVRKLSWPICIMASVVVFYGGWPIFKKAGAGISAGAPGMEFLISMASASAYGYSLYNFFLSSLHLYFDTASMLIILTLLGKMIEERAKKSVRKTLDELFALAPKKVRLVTSGFPLGRFVDLGQLKKGDRFQVEADEVIPADGIVVFGRAQIDESTLTGEARPVLATVGSPLKSGTRLIDGRVIVKATAIGADSLLGQMMTVIEESLFKKSSLEGRTDIILRYFALAIVLLALGTGGVCFVYGYPTETVLTRMVTVMVIACPCALGIAVPMARVAGIGAAGRKGIIVRDFNAFEQAGRIDTVVFDKTGTLTTGKWRLIGMEIQKNYNREFILSLAAGLEQQSDHLVAEKIRYQLTLENLAPFTVLSPNVYPDGVSGDYEGRSYFLGSRRFVQEAMNTNFSFENLMVNPEDETSKVFLTTDKVVLAVLFFGDELRSTAPKTVARLTAFNMDIDLVTGDNLGAARSVAQTLGIHGFYANLLPLEKAAYIDRLKSLGKTVAMLGDGINDAPALSRADLSAAIASSNPLTDQAAQITLLRADPFQLINFMDLARKVSRKIHQNLWCALFYNLISIPIAMGGWISPLVAVTAMLASSLTVTLNTLTLTRSKSG